MRVVALISGGKDSCYNMMQCVAEGHEIVALANLSPRNFDELDSYMYQTVGHMGIEILAKAINLPLYRKETKGKSDQTGINYVPTDDDEVEDLYSLLEWVKNELQIEAVSVGAILSDYQRVRVENVCSRLNLVSLAYLWRRDQIELLQEMIDSHVHAVIIKVAALGLFPESHLGKSLKEIQPHLLKIRDKYGINVCGEGGEYETFTLDCPLFKQRIVIEDMQVVISSADPVCPVGYVNFIKLSLQPKDIICSPTFVKNSLNYIDDLNESTYSDLSETDLSENELEIVHSQDELVLPQTSANQDLLENQPMFALNNRGWMWVGGIQCSDGSIENTFGKAITILKNILNDNSYNIRDLCCVTLYIKNMKEYETINGIYREFFNFTNPPTRVCIECPLPEDCHIIMEAVAYKALNNENHDKRHTMHVQGISHWAPANIGPYSQSIKVDEITHISGQIALVPGSMKIIEGGIRPQCKLALRHISRIAKAINTQGQLRDIVQGICFVTHPNFISEARRQWEKKTANALMDYIVVSALPRNALVEWQVWAHSHNDKFEYEETGCSIDEYTISIRRRWNYENSCAAAVCYVSTGIATSTTQLTNVTEDLLHKHIRRAQNITNETLEQIFSYTTGKLLENYPTNQLTMSSTKAVADSRNSPIAGSLCIPVIHLKIFYQITPTLSTELLLNTLNNFKEKFSEKAIIVYTVIPVCSLHNFSTFLSLCGVRHE